MRYATHIILAFTVIFAVSGCSLTEKTVDDTNTVVTDNQDNIGQILDPDVPIPKKIEPVGETIQDAGAVAGLPQLAAAGALIALLGRVLAKKKENNE